MNRLGILVILLFFSVLLISSTYATTDTIASCSASENINPSFAYAFNVLTTGSGTLQTVGVNTIGTGGTVATAIYSNVAGQPSGLLANSVFVPVTGGWNDETMTNSVTINAGTTYWLAVIFTNADNVCDGTPYFMRFYTTESTFPSTWSVVNNDNGADTFNMRMVYGSVTTSTTTSTSVTTSATTTVPATLSTSTIFYSGCTFSNIADVFACSFNIIPLLAYLVLFLLFGVGFGTSGRLSIGMLMAMMGAFIMLAIGYSVNQTVLPVPIAALVTVMFILVSWYEIHKTR